MKELIKITEQNGKQAVSARELHAFLEAKERFSAWCKRMFKYGFIKNVDYVGCKEFNTLANQELEEYALTIDCAKEISMLQRSEKGKQARQYFIQKEKELREIQKPLSQLEVLQQSINMLVEQDKRLSDVESKVKQIEAKTTTRPDFFTIVGYGMLHGIRINLKQASRLGQKASKLCKERGIETDTTPDPRFGTVKTYPTSILDEVFEMSII